MTDETVDLSPPAGQRGPSQQELTQVYFRLLSKILDFLSISD
jgi:hypothetical protein